VKWSGPRKCDWPGCLSKAVFRSRSSLNAHVKNVHVSPLLCTHPGCSYKKPFGKKCDLARHVKTVHSTEQAYPCVDSKCPQVFSRKDKMMEHARQRHELFHCARNHCSEITTADQMQSHSQEAHGRYECAIGSCRSGKTSHFLTPSLQAHIVKAHGATTRFARVAILLGPPLVTSEGSICIGESSWLAVCRDCASCSTTMI